MRKRVLLVNSIIVLAMSTWHLMTPTNAAASVSSCSQNVYCLDFCEDSPEFWCYPCPVAACQTVPTSACGSGVTVICGDET
jgi:hypothetical protein